MAVPMAAKSLPLLDVRTPQTFSRTINLGVRHSVTNDFIITGYDRLGQLFPGASASLTVQYAGTIPDPTNVVVISEIMYNPVTPDASYLEIYNSSAKNSFDLSRWRLRGVSFTFPVGTVGELPDDPATA